MDAWGPLWARSSDVLTGADAMRQRSEKGTSRSGQRWTDRPGGESTGFADNGSFTGCCPILCLIRVDGTPRKDSGQSCAILGTANGNEGPMARWCCPVRCLIASPAGPTIGLTCVESECRWVMRGCPDVRVGPMGHGHGTSGRNPGDFGRGLCPLPMGHGEVGMRVSKHMNDREPVQQRRLP